MIIMIFYYSTRLGPDRPDVRQAAILSFATLVHNVYYVGGAMSKDAFEEYVQKYYNFFISKYILYIKKLRYIKKYFLRLYI